MSGTSAGGRMRSAAESDTPLSIGIDVGGTRIKLGLVELATSSVIALHTVPTAAASLDAFVTTLADAIGVMVGEAGVDERQIAGIGLGLPGYVDRAVVTLLPPSLSAIETHAPGVLLAERLGIPVASDNDARLIALGECRSGGHGHGARFLSLTFGTGVGFGFVVDGVLRETSSIDHLAPHFPVRPGARPCFCGIAGCFESVTCAARLQEDAAAAGLDAAERIFSDHSAIAKSLADAYLDDLAAGLNALSYLFAPDLIVLGGGVAQGFAPLLPAVSARLFAKPFPAYRVALRPSLLGERAGVIGAAALASTEPIQQP